MALTQAAGEFIYGLNEKFVESGYEFDASAGRKYDKITLQRPGLAHTKRVYAFVNRETGGVYKAASYAAPAKGERYASVAHALQRADLNGSFLYIR